MGPTPIWCCRAHMAASEFSLAKDLTIETLGNTRTRCMLSATEAWRAAEVARGHPSEKIGTGVQWKEPVSRDAEQMDFVIQTIARKLKSMTDGKELQDGQGMNEKELQDASDNKYGSGASENNNSGTHTTASLTSSLKKVKFIREANLLLDKDDQALAPSKGGGILLEVCESPSEGVN